MRKYNPTKEQRKEIYTELLAKVEEWAAESHTAAICVKLWFLYVNHYPEHSDFPSDMDIEERICPTIKMSNEVFEKFPEFAEAYKKYYVKHCYSLLTDETRPLALQMAIELCEQ